MIHLGKPGQSQTQSSRKPAPPSPTKFAKIPPPVPKTAAALKSKDPPHIPPKPTSEVVVGQKKSPPTPSKSKKPVPYETRSPLNSKRPPPEVPSKLKIVLIESTITLQE